MEQASPDQRTEKGLHTQQDQIELRQPGQPQETEKFEPGWKLLCAFTSIAIVNLACALDATIISVALPVCLPPSSCRLIVVRY